MKRAMLSLFFASTAFASGSSQLRPLVDQNHVNGASCSFWLANAKKPAKDYLQWDLLSAGWINLGGSDLKLTFVKDPRVPNPQDQLPLGHSRKREFSGHGVQVILRTRVTWLCPGNDDSCEAWREGGEIEVKMEKQRWKSQIKGMCGS